MSIGINSVTPSSVDMFSAKASPATVDGSGAGREMPKVEEQKKSDVPATPERQVTKEDLIDMSKIMSQFLSMTNADLKFEIHDGTNRLMVNLVDGKSNKILKTFPSKEFLDMVARIKDYVGMIIDRKA